MPTESVIIEAQDDKGLRWLIRVIRSGLSKNGNYYPDGVLRESVPLFEGAQVFVKPDEVHSQGRGKDFNRLIGRLSEATFVEGQKDKGEIQATLDILSSAGDAATKLLEAFQREMSDLFGFSIDADGEVKTIRRGTTGRPVREVHKISKVNSVDLIVDPSAGGEVLKLVEAIQQEDDRTMKLIETMLAEIKDRKAVLLEGLDTEDESEVLAAFQEAIKDVKPDPVPATAGQAEQPKHQINQADIDGVIAGMEQRINLAEARAHLRSRLAESKLPDVVKTKISGQFDAQDNFTTQNVDDTLKSETEFLAKLTESGFVTGMGDQADIKPGEQQSEKVDKMLDAFFDPEDRSVRSFRECYVQITGDKRVTGRMDNCDRARLTEAISSTTFDDVLGNSITRRMVADYRTPSQYDVWKRLATTTQVGDFRLNERTRMGGYGDLPAVAENGSYDALTSPADEKATYAVTKRGGKETISLETIRNDDVGVIQRVPIKLSRAAQRTLSKFVLDFLVDNSAIYDTVVLFHATHGNLGTTALSAATYAAGRLAMMKQAEAGSSDRLGIGPANIFIPLDLEETAFDIFQRATNNDPDFVESQRPRVSINPVWYWTDLNNWYLSADPMEIPTIEIGFLDGNEEPEIFVADMPTQGSLFTNDQWVYKIRFIFGGNVLEYRGLYGAVVA